MRGVGYVPRAARAACGSRRRTYLENHFGGLLNAGRTVGSQDPAMCRRCKWWLIPNTSTVVRNHLLFVILVETLLQELTSAPHFDSGWPSSPPFCGYRLNSRTTVFQTDNEGASPSARSAQPQQPFLEWPLQGCCAHFSEPILREDRRLQHGARGFNSLSALCLPQTPHTTVLDGQMHDGSRRVGYPRFSDKESALRSIRR